MNYELNARYFVGNIKNNKMINLISYSLEKLKIKKWHNQGGGYI